MRTKQERCLVLQPRHARRERRPTMLCHGLERWRVLLVQPLVDPHVPEHRRNVVTRLPVRNGLDPKHGIALVVNRGPARDREWTSIVRGNDARKLARSSWIAAHHLDE